MLNFFMSIFVHLFFLFVVAKGLTGDWKLQTKETVHLILTGLLLSFVRVFVLQFDFPNLSAQLFSDMNFLMILFLYIPAIFFYFYKARLLSIRNSISLMATAIAVSLVSDFIVDIFSAVFFPAFRLYWTMTLMQDPLPVAVHLLLHGTVATLFVLWILRAARRLYAAPALSNRLQNLLLGISVTALALVIAALFIFYSRAADFSPGEDWSWPVFAAFSVIYIFLVISLVHTRYISQKYERERKEAEHKDLKFYTDELERQHTAMRKFKHDYQNILTSMDGFFAARDWAGLEQYYTKEIKPASEILTKDDFALQALGKIKVPEIKSILAAKLIMAQNMSMDISTFFEAHEEINHIPMESVPLVRMLGIILDNAIEELAALSGGKLAVACFRGEDALTFVVQNTCRSDIQKLHVLRRPGFSTKGEGRGFGLAILDEIEASYPNITRSTAIEAGTFTQTVTIRSAREGVYP